MRPVVTFTRTPQQSHHQRSDLHIEGNSENPHERHVPPK
jgi:hypothetical protein